MIGRTNLIIRFITACVLFFLPAIAAATEGPIAHWKFDETSGTIAYDSADSHNGTLVNGPVWTTGKIDGALNFDGSNDYVDCGYDFASVAGSTKKTISLWAKSDKTDYSTAGRLFSLYKGDSSSCFCIGVTGNPAAWQFIYMKGSNSVDRLDSGVAVIAGQWQHIVLVQNGANVSCYINGVFGNSANNGAAPSISSPSNADIGCYWGGYSAFFDGAIDDVRIYDRALSSGEILELYAGNKAFAPNPADGAVSVTPNMVLRWSPAKVADSHDVYLGTSYDGVKKANTLSPEYKGNFDVNTFDPCGLALSTTYYWRIDEVNGTDLWKGDLWSFKTGDYAVGVLYVPSEYPTIQSAIDAATKGYVVIVAPGTYTGTGNRDIDLKGKSITVRSADPNDRDIVAATIIDCQGTSSNPHRGFYFHNREDATSIIAGFTIKNGYADSGGGIYCGYDSSPTVRNCTITGNSAIGGNGGGMCIDSVSRPTLTNCIFGGNSGGWGGGMHNEGSPKLANCTFSGNLGSWGGGILNYSSMTLANCTFSGNSATYGGGINNNGSVTLANCVFWGNTATHGPQINGGSKTITFSDIQGGMSGTGNINADPCFVNAAGGDLHLLPASPCINAGDPNFIPIPNETDFDGEPRIMLSRVDMGADEFNPFEIDLTVVNKRRVDRTLFEYDCSVTLTNISNYSVCNVFLEIINVPENMLLIDPTVTFGSLEIAPGQSAISSDTCTFQVDRSQSTDPVEIIWQSTCEVIGGASGVLDTTTGVYILNLEIIPGDITGNDRVDFEDLAILADQWLLPPGSPSADIAPLPVGDDFVDFLDFAVLAQNWLRSSPD